jgi:hypothetical protein
VASDLSPAMVEALRIVARREDDFGTDGVPLHGQHRVSADALESAREVLADAAVRMGPIYGTKWGEATFNDALEAYRERLAAVLGDGEP